MEKILLFNLFSKFNDETKVVGGEEEVFISNGPNSSQHSSYIRFVEVFWRFLLFG